MAPLVNTLKKQVDLPVWEWTRFAPLVSSALSCSCAPDNTSFNAATHGRYIYYLISAVSFWRYDTWTDTYLQLSSPPVAPVTWASMNFSGALGPEGMVLSAGASTIVIPTYGKAYIGLDVKIVSGTGAGQRRRITGISDPIIGDSGVPTAVNNVLGAITITDTLKAWVVNQWVGYNVRIMTGPGVGQVRKVLGNTATVLTLGDSTISAHESRYNPMLFSPAASATAGAQSMYQIESATVTVDSNWIVNPDATSKFQVLGGVIFLASSAAATPFYSLQEYDVVTDTWYIRTAQSNLITAVGTDGTLEKVTENGSVWEGNIATGGTTTSLIDNTKNWTINQWAGYYVRIYSGAGDSQLRPILSNTADTLVWSVAGTAPTSTSRYLIDGFDAGTATSGSSTTLVDSSKAWSVNRWKNYAVKIISGTGKGQESPILSNTATTITLVKAGAVLDATSVYVILGDTDKLLLLLGGQSTPIIQNLDDDIATLGRAQDSGVARQGSVELSTAAGVTAGKPIAMTSISGGGAVVTVTTALPHNFKVGQQINVKGVLTTTAYNNTPGSPWTIAAITSPTVFTYTSTVTGSGTFTGHSVTTLTDSTKNWSVNQWAGYIVYMTTTAVTAATGVATGQALQVASNTATTLTFVTGTAPTNGITRYVISQRNIIGTMAHGLATGTQSTTTLQDTNISTFSGTGSVAGNILTISAVSVGYLTIGSVVAGTSVSAGSTVIGYGPNTYGGVGTYILSLNSTAGSTAITSAGWAVNFFGGRRLKLIGGTGQSIEVVITSNTANTLTFGATTAPVTLVTSYAITNTGAKGVGTQMRWIFGGSNPNLRGKYFIVPRGGAVVGFDRLDINSDTWDLMQTTPQIETLGSGSMYAYDGVDKLFFTKDVTQRMYSLDLITNKIDGAGIYPYVVGTVISGNRMEVFSTEDGLKYLWLNRHSFTECYRQLIFF
jgi:hypothetical protein